MKTRHIPALVMLIGVIARSIIGIVHKEVFSFSYVFSVLLVLLVFYIIGVVIKSLFDKYIPLPKEEEENTEEDSETPEERELENFEETDEAGLEEESVETDEY